MANNDRSQGRKWHRIVTRPLLLVIFTIALLCAAVLVLELAGKQRLKSSDVAIVDGQRIPLNRYRSIQLEVEVNDQPGSKTIVLPDPPEFMRCALALQSRETRRRHTLAELKNVCSADFRYTNEISMRTLLEQNWYEREASKRGIKVSISAVSKAMRQQVEAAFPQPGAFERFLKNTNQTTTQVRDLIAAQIAKSMVNRQLVGHPAVTATAIEAVYRAHRRQYLTPESRDVKIYFARSLDAVRTAIAVARRGHAFPAVPADSGGGPRSIRDATRQQFSGQLRARIFSARENVVTGPVRSRLGYDAFIVTRINRPRQLSLSEASPIIRTSIQARLTKIALEKAKLSLYRRWRQKTLCAENFATSLCSNGPPLTATTLPPGG